MHYDSYEIRYLSGFTELLLLVACVDLTVDSTVKSILELSSDLSLWLEKIVVK